MNGIGFQLARPANGSGGMIPLTVEYPIASGYAEAQGALLLVNAGNYEGCGADPAQIAAVSTEPGGADTSGFNILGRKEYPPLTMRGYSLADTQFLAPYMGSVPASIGGTFGVTRDTDGVWKVDFNKVGGTAVTYLGFPDKSPADAAGAGQDTLALVEFLAGIIQPIG